MNNKKCSCGGAQFDYAGRCLACRREKSPMNKTTPDKEKLREEWNKLSSTGDYFIDVIVDNKALRDKIADWWLDKMEAQKADTIALIEELRAKDRLDSEGHPDFSPEYERALDDFLSILRKEI